MNVIAWRLAWTGEHQYTRWHVVKHDGETMCGIGYNPSPITPEQWTPEEFLGEIQACGNCKRVLRALHKESERLEQTA